MPDLGAQAVSLYRGKIESPILKAGKVLRNQGCYFIGDKTSTDTRCPTSESQASGFFKL